jgi:hypothetical protein
MVSGLKMLAEKSRAVYSWVIRLTSLLSSLPWIPELHLKFKLKGGCAATDKSQENRGILGILVLLANSQ